MKRTICARWRLSIVIAIILNGSLAVTALAVDLRWIVGFHEGTPLDVQVQVVENTLSSVLHILSLINALAIELPPVLPEVALAVLQADPLVERVDGDPE